MYRPAFASFRYLRETSAGVALITAAAIGPLHAQQSTSCRLLQVAELDAAIGGKATGAEYIKARYTASHTTGAIPRGKGSVEVDVVRPVDGLPSIATVGALVQKAFSRI